MINELLEITKYLSSLIISGIDYDKKKAKAFFDLKIIRYYELFNATHQDYIATLDSYKLFIKNTQEVNLNSFNELIRQINDDMSRSFDKRSSLLILNILNEIERKKNKKIDKFYLKSSGFIRAVNEYLLGNVKNKIQTEIKLPARPREINDKITDISQVDFNEIYPESGFYNVSRETLIYWLKREFNEYQHLQNSDNLKDYLKNNILQIIDNAKIELTKRYLKVRLEYEELENMII